MRRIVLVVVVLAGVLPASAQAWTWPVDGKVLRPFVFGDDVNMPVPDYEKATNPNFKGCIDRKA